MTLSSATSVPRPRVRPAPTVLLRAGAVAHADRLVTRGDLVRVRPGVLAPAEAWRSLPPWQRYLARVHAVLLLRPDAVPCLESAAALHGMPVFGDPVTVHLLDHASGTSREAAGVRTHISTGDREVVDVDAVRVVARLDTAVDLARSRHPAIGLAAADAVLRLDAGTRVEMLVAANESRRSSRGRRLARWVTHRATDLAETPLESVSRAAVEWLGFDEPELQRVFPHDAGTDRVDMWWPAPRAVGEADGDLKYDGSLNPGAAAIRDEKERDRRLRRAASGVAHWGWRDVADVEPLRTELLRAGLRIRHPGDPRSLAGLRFLTARRP